MSESPLLLLGNKNLSSWSLRPWLLLRHAGLPFRERVLPFEAEGWRDTIVSLSPTGRVPVLHDGELVVWDSLAICEYLADAHPEAKLWPTERQARAHARAVSAEMHAGFPNLRREMSMDVTARRPGHRTSHETATEVKRVLAIWSECRERARELASEEAGPFLFGRFSIADAMFAPVVWRFRTYDVDVQGAARDWYETMLALPAMLEWEQAAAAEVAALAVSAAAAAPTRTPDPRSAQHCYAVIFSSKLTERTGAGERTDGTDEAPDAYDAAADAMVALAAKQPGFLGVESARGADGFGITVSYWDSPQAIHAWKEEPSHALVQARGKKSFYERYEVRVAAVERGYKFPA